MNNVLNRLAQGRYFVETERASIDAKLRSMVFSSPRDWDAIRQCFYYLAVGYVAVLKYRSVSDAIGKATMGRFLFVGGGGEGGCYSSSCLSS